MTKKDIVDEIFSKEQSTPISEAQESHKKAVERRANAYRVFAIAEPAYLKAKRELEQAKENEESKMRFLTSCICVQHPR